MNLFEKACRQALLDLYFDLAACNNLIKKHPDWGWLKAKKAELEAKEAELTNCIRKLQKIRLLVQTKIQKEGS